MNFSELQEELKHKERTIKDLVEYLKTRTVKSNPNYNLLLGAGASVTSGINSAQDLVKEWRKEIYSLLSGEDYQDNDEEVRNYLLTKQGHWYSELNEYSALFEKKFDLPSQRRRFVEREVDDKKPSIGYAYLVSMSNANDRYFDTIYTTNFDDLINEAFYQFSHNRPLVCAHDSSVRSLSISSTRPKIIKLHGDYLFDDIKSTLRETESLESNIKNKFIEFSKEYGLIVVGYAGNDRSIMDVLNHLLKSDDYFKNGIYWCIREGDTISPELRKLLWKDRVYFVSIRGFDELMAELHHQLKKELPIKDNFVESKQEIILRSFQEDKFKLSDSSQYIKKDIDNLLKHKNNIVISDLIRELASSDDKLIDDISESEFKNLLEIDAKIKSKHLKDALELARGQVEKSKNTTIKIRYIKKVIYILRELNDINEWGNYCDKLIEIDSNNVEYYLAKSESIISLYARCEYLKSLSDKFSHVYKFNNFFAKTALNEIKNTNGISFYSIDNVIDLIEKSLVLEPSLSNVAWNILCDAYSMKYSNCFDHKEMKECDGKVSDLLEKADGINNKHITYFQILTHSVNRRIDQSKIIKIIDELKECFNISSISKKKFIFDLICGELIDMLDKRMDNFDYKPYYREFYNSDLIISYKDKEKTAAYNIFISLYYLNIELNVDLFKKYIIEASRCDDAAGYTGKIINYMCDVIGDFELALTFLNDVKNQISDDVYYYWSANIALIKKDYRKAKDDLDRALKEGRSYDEYLVCKSFILIHEEEYNQVIALVNEKIDTVKDFENQSILTLNREFSSKKLNRKIKETEIRNIIGRNISDNLNLCCNILLNNENAALRLIEKEQKRDQSSIETFLRWPIVSERFYSELNSRSLFRNDSTNVVNL